MHVSRNSAYKDLVDALRLRREIIADHAMRDSDPDAHLEALKHVSERIVATQYTLPTPIDPRLSHYLAQCSYEKALTFLEEYSAEEG